VSLAAQVVDPDGAPSCPTGSPTCVSYAWSTRIGAAAYTALGSSKVLSWIPAITYGSACSSFTVELRLCATDPDGTTCQSGFANLGYTACR